MVLTVVTGDSVQKVVDGRKCGTTRRSTKHWLRVVKNFEDGKAIYAHLWAGSPRNKGTFLWSAKIVRAVLVRGRQYDGEMILKDGFQTKTELAMRLAAHYVDHPVRPEDADYWFNREWWVFIEWENPPKVEIQIQAKQGELTGRAMVAVEFA